MIGPRRTDPTVSTTAPCSPSVVVMTMTTLMMMMMMGGDDSHLCWSSASSPRFLRSIFSDGFCPREMNVSLDASSSVRWQSAAADSRAWIARMFSCSTEHTEHGGTDVLLFHRTHRTWIARMFSCSTEHTQHAMFDTHPV